MKNGLTKLNVLLQKELEVLDVQRNIRSRVEKEMGDMQREYILREQLKAIQQELGVRDGHTSEIEDYKARITEVSMPAEVEEKALKELDRLDKMPYASPEGVVIRNYLDWLVSLPWNARTEDSIDIDEAMAVLEKDHYGLAKVKERIIEFLAVRKLTKRNERAYPVLCRTPGSRQDEHRKVHSESPRAQVLPAFSGWCERRGGDPRPQEDIRRRYARKNYPGHKADRKTEPCVHAG